MTPTLTKHPRCETHRHALLTSEGICVTCDRVAFTARMSTAEHAKEAAKLQALARAQRPTSGDKRRRMTGAEAERIAGGVL